LALLVVDADVAAADDADFAHLAAYERRVRRHAAALGQYPLGGGHPPDVLGRRLHPHQYDLLAAFGPRRGVGGVKDDLAGGGARARVQAARDDLARFDRGLLLLRVEHRPEEVVELLRLHREEGFLLAHQTLGHHIDGDGEGGVRRPLAGAGLQQPQPAALERELDVLQVAEVGLELGGRLLQLAVYVGHLLAQRRDGLRRPHPGDDVFALGVGEVFAVEARLARGRVAGKGDARARVVAQVAEHHRLDVGRGAPLIRDVVYLAVGDGARVVPRREDRPYGPPQLLARVVWKVDALAFLHRFFEEADQLPQVVGAQLDVEVDAAVILEGLYYLLERVDVVFRLGLQAQDDVAVHLDEAPVRVVRRPRVPHLARQAGDGLVVQADVEDGVHHPRHRNPRAGPHRQQQRLVDVAEPAFQRLLHPSHVELDFPVQAGREIAVPVVIDARLGGNGKAGRHGDADIGHLRQAGAFAAQQVLHLRGAFRGAVAEEIYVFFIHKPLRGGKRLPGCAGYS
jgi:hypothetical protein